MLCWGAVGPRNRQQKKTDYEFHRHHSMILFCNTSNFQILKVFALIWVLTPACLFICVSLHFFYCFTAPRSFYSKHTSKQHLSISDKGLGLSVSSKLSKVYTNVWIVLCVSHVTKVYLLNSKLIFLQA